MIGYLSTLTCCFSLLAMIFTACSTNVADGGSGTNVGNAIVSGIIQDESGQPVSHTRVALLRVNHNPVVNPEVLIGMSDTTDTEGKYQFSVNEAGTYNIEAEHMVQKTKLLIQNIDIATDSAISIPAEMLKKTGTIKLALKQPLQEGYIYIPGTSISQTIESLQTGTDSLIISYIPAGNINNINYVFTADTTGPVSLATNIPVTPQDTTDSNTPGTFSPTEEFFVEYFEDGNFAARNWYDIVEPVLTTSEHIENSTSAIEYSFLKGDSVPTGGNVMRHLFTETASLYISFYIKYSENWQGSTKNMGADVFTISTNVDGDYTGPGYNSLSIHIQQDSGRPNIHISDSENIDVSNIGRDLTNISETRAVAGCNGDGDGYGDGTCIQSGSQYLNLKSFSSGNNYFQDTPGKYYKNDWHFIEIYLKLNSIQGDIGLANGEIKYWYDGELIMNFTHVIFRTNQHPTMKFRQLIMAPNVSVSPVNQSYWLDNLTIAR
ncbi:MAG: carboxypeptidase regulatory-like domain-containing protein [Fibrobacteria bacterium]|nr:carboxypeptidase regulatory-like domain-containing protein [Fibrobacteria bacterium]